MERRLYPEWSAALREETGIDNGYRRTGGVDVACTPEEEHDLALDGRSVADRGDRLRAARARRLRPGRAGPEPRPARRLLPARPRPDPQPPASPGPGRGRRGAGRGSEPDEPVVGFETRRRPGHGRPDGRRARSPAGGRDRGGGPWSGGLLDGLGVRAPTPPLKGQIVLLRGDRPLLRRIVEHGKNYLVPRDDGRVLVGATEEDAGFDTPTDAGRRPRPASTRRCGSAPPCRGRGRDDLGGAPPRQHRHPALPRHRPRLRERCSSPPATSAPACSSRPATAEVIADLVLGRPPRIDLSPFRVDREPDPVEDEAFRS